MNQNEHERQIDADILQCRKDILRAKDIVPHKPDEQGGSPDKIAIPKFDLAEDIMAEQRKVTAIKRKAPGLKLEVQESPVVKQMSRLAACPMTTPCQNDDVISQIVARDISTWCRGRL